MVCGPKKQGQHCCEAAPRAQSDQPQKIYPRPLRNTQSGRPAAQLYVPMPNQESASGAGKWKTILSVFNVLETTSPK